MADVLLHKDYIKHRLKEERDKGKTDGQAAKIVNAELKKDWQIEVSVVTLKKQSQRERKKEQGTNVPVKEAPPETGTNVPIDTLKYLTDPEYKKEYKKNLPINIFEKEVRTMVKKYLKKHPGYMSKIDIQGVLIKIKKKIKPTQEDADIFLESYKSQAQPPPKPPEPEPPATPEPEPEPPKKPYKREVEY